MKKYRWLNTIAFACVLAVNALANLLPLGGKTTGQVSEMYPNLFTPAPVTFAIWGVIYSLLAVFVMYQWSALGDREGSDSVRESVGLWFAVSCMFNVGWIFSWHFDAIAISLLCIAGMLISVIAIEAVTSGFEGRFLARLAAKSGFDLLYGWTIAATVSNVSVLLTKIGWNGWGLSDSFWTVCMILVSAVIGCAIVMIGHNPIAGAAIIWAFAGILVRHFSPVGFAKGYPFVIGACLVGAGAIVSAIAITLYKDLTLREITE